MIGAATFHLETFSVVVRLDAEQLPRALELLGSVREPLLARRSCRTCRIERDVRDPFVVRFTEEWHDPAAFLSHLRSNEFWPVLIALDLSSQEPDVFIGGLTGQQGLAALERLRAGSAPGAAPAVEPACPADDPGARGT